MASLNKFQYSLSDSSRVSDLSDEEGNNISPGNKDPPPAKPTARKNPPDPANHDRRRFQTESKAIVEYSSVCSSSTGTTTNSSSEIGETGCNRLLYALLLLETECGV
mmetsp:Transcript_27415/g.74974  ORF Transcript_27415/g.74974 Transcript_27415/m.74974 type:complete len:107 (+) Transcript_27415:286-606(+)